MVSPDLVSKRIGIAKHWLSVAEASGANNVIKNRAQRAAERMGINECAWLLLQDSKGDIHLPEEEKRELQLLVARYSPSTRPVQFTSYEGHPKVKSSITAALF